MPACHRVKLERAGIPGSYVTVFVTLDHEWAKLEPGKSYKLMLQEVDNDEKS